MAEEITNATLHHHILQHVVQHGHGPDEDDLAGLFEVDVQRVREGLDALVEEHGVVLHPGSHRIWVIHPFSLAPTNFWVRSAKGSWWGNCAWCSLGVAALLAEDCTITSTLGGHDEQVQVEIRDGEVFPQDLWVHFSVPMTRAWENVIYTCSTMLLFASPEQVDAWCSQHGIPRGDVQPLPKVWELARVWYGEHLSPTWTKWSVDEAREIFRRFDLGGPIWQLPDSEGRF